MLKARISRDEFESYLRLSGIEELSGIKSSYLEINGQVLSKKSSEKTEKLLLLRLLLGDVIYILL